MKTAICYYSEHHGNTKKLLDAIKDYDPEVVLIDCTKTRETDLLGFDRIGFASGIYYGAFAKPLLSFAQINLPDKKDVFFLFTCGNMSSGYTKRIREAAEAKEARILGEYGCFGFDTFGPFKLVGGIKKDHPTEEEIQGAVEFYKKIF
ncbi:MAG: flavodoxin [Lachnospiraceae bacterium]|nr:flavodoxin [Lachnospiraceae bacterium]